MDTTRSAPRISDIPRCLDISPEDTERIWAEYNRGTPMFPETAIRALEEQLEQGTRVVQATDMLGKVKKIKIAPRQTVVRFLSFAEIIAEHRHTPRGFGPFHTIYLDVHNCCPNCVPPNQSATVADCERIFEEAEKKFKESPVRKNLFSGITDAASTSSPQAWSKIKKIVAFGLGTLERGGDVHNAMQHVFVLALKRLLDGLKFVTPDDPDAVICYVQDPAYTESDKTVLLSKGIQVLAGNDGLFQVDSTAVVISGGPDRYPLEDLVAERSRPAMLFTSVPDEEMPMMLRWGPRAREMISQYEDWTIDDDDACFHGEFNLFIRHDFFPWSNKDEEADKDDNYSSEFCEADEDA
ncbi:hypothetical protein GQ53DRAFT_845460 [Thozetella sp. PMI_491]|nr:hypothetical protein GQ53DRAFT_845460 [Thozetella sp. PMI_491]